MAKLLKKAYEFLLGTEYDEDNYVEEYEEEVEEIVPIKEKKEQQNYGSRKRPTPSPSEDEKIVRIHTDVQLEIVIAKPDVVEDATMLVDYLRDHKTCVVNLEGVEWENAQRIADFLSGAAYAFCGDIQRISNEIFIIAPTNVNISGKLKEELKASGYIFPRVSSDSFR